MQDIRQSIVENLPSRPTDLVFDGVGLALLCSTKQTSRRGSKSGSGFYGCNRNGVMLHAAMIYGGNQEIYQRLLGAIRRFPVLPAPGGGRQIVQPIYIDDIVDCLFVAATTKWAGRHVVALAGKPLSWRAMAKLCAKSIGRRCVIIPVPAFLLLVAISLLNKNSCHAD